MSEGDRIYFEGKVSSYYWARKMELSLDQTEKDQTQFVKSISEGNWQASVEQFAEVLAQRDKLYLVAKSLCVSHCKGDEAQAEAMLIVLLNEAAEELLKRDRY